MNRTTTIAVCFAMLMIGFAFMAASSGDSSGEGPFSGYELDVTGVDNLGVYTFLGTEYRVIRDADTRDYGDSTEIGTDVIIDSSGIRDGCFKNSGIRSVLLTGRVASIGSEAFMESSALESVARCDPASMTIGSAAFEGCSALKMVDLRGSVVIASNAFGSSCDAIVIANSDHMERPAPSCRLLRIADLGEDVKVAVHGSAGIVVPYAGQGLLQIADDEGNRGIAARTVESGADVYVFEPIDGKDMVVGYMTLTLDYQPEDLTDAEIEVRSDAIELLDLSEGDPRGKAWKGWKEIQSDTMLGYSIDRDGIWNLGYDTLKLEPQSKRFTVSFHFTYDIPGTESVPSSTAGSFFGEEKFPAVPNTEHYRCIGWLKSDDPSMTIYPIGSPIRTYRDMHAFAAWAPFDQFNYSIQYTNVDGSVLGEPYKQAHGKRITVGDAVPSDIPSDRLFEGWRIEGSDTVYRSGDSLIAERPIRFVPVLNDAREIPLIVDGETIGTMNVSIGSATTVTADDPSDPDRLFTGWVSDGIGPLFKGDSAVLDGVDSLRATWRDKLLFTVTYLSDGLEVPGSSCTVKERDSAVIHADATKAGHVLRGWSDGSSVIEDGSEIVVTRSITLEAVWEAEGSEAVQFKVTYKTDPEKTRLYPSGARVLVDDAPGARPGYRFAGWSNTDGGEVALRAGDSFEISCDRVLHPVWEEIPVYTVTYHPDAGDPVIDRILEGDSAVIRGKLGERPGSQFLGWSRTVNGAAMAEGAELPVYSNIDLYPIWKEEDRYTVTYHVNGNMEIVPVNPGDEYVISFTPEKRRGFSFEGWSLAPDGTKRYSNGDSVRLSADMDLYAVWKNLKVCSVVYMTDPPTKAKPAYEGEEFEIGFEPPGATGFEFIGWSLERNGDVDYVRGDSIVLEGDVALYPVWRESVSFTIEFRLDDRTVTKKVYEGQRISLSCQEAERHGYELQGWSREYGGSKDYDVGFEIVPRMSIALYPVWKAIPAFTVTYHGLSVEPVTALLGETVTLREGPVKEGSTFQGWSTTDGGPVEYKAGGRMTVRADTDLYPVWGDDPVIVITYLCDGGIRTFAYRPGDIATLLGAQTKAGHSFEGWSLTPNGSVDYPAGSSLRVSSDMDLYPVWTVNAPDAPSGPSDGKDASDAPRGSDDGGGSAIGIVPAAVIAGAVVGVVALMVMVLRRT